MGDPRERKDIGVPSALLPKVSAKTAKEAKLLIHDRETLWDVRDGNRYLFRYLDSVADSPATVRGAIFIAVALHLEAKKQGSHLPSVTPEIVDEFWDTPFWEGVSDVIKSGANDEEMLEEINELTQITEHVPTTDAGLEEENPELPTYIKDIVDSAKKKYNFNAEEVEEMETMARFEYGLLRLAAQKEFSKTLGFS